MFGWGSEFAWHSWRAIIRVPSHKGIRGSFYSSLCVVGGLFFWVYSKNPPSLWVVVICSALMPATFVYLRYGAFDTWSVLGVDTRSTSTVDDLRNDAKSGRVGVQQAISEMAELAERHPDFRIRRFILTGISDLADPVAVPVLRHFLKDEYWQVQYAAVVGLRRLVGALDAKGMLSADQARGILAELNVVLSDSRCDPRLKASVVVRQFQDGLRSSLERDSNKNTE
jgi:hypothetical protein